MSYWIIVAFACLAIFIAFKMNNFRTKVSYFFIITGMGFLLLTGFMIFSGKGLDLSTVEGVSSSVKTYAAWLSQAGSKVTKISAYVFNQEWREENEPEK